MIRTLLAVLLFLTAATAQAGSAAGRIVWIEGNPHVEVSLEGQAPRDAKVIDVPAELFDGQGARLWAGVVKVPLDGPSPWKGRVALAAIKEPKKQHRVTLALQHADFGRDWREDVYFGQETSAIQTYGLRTLGVHPERKVFLTLGLNGIRGEDARQIPLSLRVRDGEDNAAYSRQAALATAAAAKLHVLDVTPDTATALGPFSLEATIESEAHQLFFNATLRFAHAGNVVPFSGMEHGDPALWFATSPQHRPSYQTGQMYYSPHLTDLKRADSPAVSYDRAVKRSGRQALRIDYPVSRESDVWGLQALPGKPLGLWLWVHGNDSADQLVVHFEDNSNFTLPAWERRANFSSATVCKLDFSGWKAFRVPVLGDGLQVASLKGSTDKVDAPIRILAFTIKPAPALKPAADKAATRTVWIDDLAAETQASPNELIALEVQNDTPEGRLTSESVLGISVGNGHSVALKKGRLTLAAKDGKQNTIWTTSVDLEVPAGDSASTTVKLRELWDKNPRGPIDLDVTFQDVSRPGTRVSRRLTLKGAAQTCVVHDFEEPVTFNGYQPGKVGKSAAKVVPGGADGTGHALALEVKPKQEDNSVLFHPSLPGVVDRIEMMIKGGDRPVSLQPWLLDSGYTGIWLRACNLFTPEPITVDWQGWRKVVVAAPPVPAHFGDKNRYFLFRPWYPLHLALNARTADGDTPVEIRIDDVRVVTSLPDDEQLQAELDYPDETRLHPPGAPLRLIVRNFGSETPMTLRYELRNYQGLVARSGTVEVRIPSGVKQKVTLLEALPAGIFDLSVSDAGGRVKRNGCIQVLDAKRYFGDDPLELLVDPLRLRRQLGLMTEKIYLDWDNFEAAPHLHHHHWFEEELKKLRALPILPKELADVLKKSEDAQAAVKKAEETLRTNRQQEVQAIQAEKSAEQKLAATEKLLPPARVEEETTSKAAKAADEKATTMTKEDVAAKPALTETLKVLQAAETILKTAQAAVPVAEKEQQTATTAVKDAEMKAALAQTAAVAATKEVADAEKALKSAEADPKQKDKLKPLQDRVAVGKKRGEVARADVVKTTAAVTLLKTAAEKARLAVEMARKKVQADTTSVQTARQNQQQAMQKAMTAQRNAEQAKRDATAAQQRHQAAKNRLDAVTKMFDTDRMALEDKRKLRVAAREAIEKGEQTIEETAEAARTAAEAFERAKSPFVPKAIPVVGFCAEWAGPEPIEAMQKGVYTRWIPNRLQLPRRLIDWSEFVRATQREHKGRFDNWVFWENPDLEESPQSIPPKMYRPMLEAFARWVKLYSPEAKVVAGGFNFPRAADYLAQIKEAHTLPFDEIAVQVNLGELSPEHADLEGFLDELNDLLKVRETKRTVRPSELDWSIGKHLSPLQQAAYHARATLILDSRGVPAHQFSLINSGFDFEGFGVFYRGSYGSSPEIQTYKPYHMPKPAYFALMETRRFLSEWKFVASVQPPDRSLADNRAFVYRNAAGRLTAVLWRALDSERLYRLPTTWKGATARDVFGFAAALDRGLRLTPLPTLVELPAGLTLEQLIFDLRTLQTEDGSAAVILDLHIAEEDSAKRASYRATGALKPVVRGGLLLGERKVRETYLEGIESEQFDFELAQPGNVLLKRRWYFDGEGSKLFVKLNGGSELEWDLGKGQGNEKGLRETAFVLRDAKAGRNTVQIRHQRAGNGAGYRLEPVPADHVPLVRLGPLNGRQTKGDIVKHASAAGTPLTLDRTVYETGLGTHATSFLEYPLSGQYAALEVTVGIDGSTEGRGSVLFRIFVDGKERATSGLMNGFSKPKVLKVDKLEGARRVILSVTDAGDGNRDDLANWVEGKLFLRR